MKARARLSAMIVPVFLLSLGTPALAQSTEPCIDRGTPKGTRFEATTDGSPLATELGGWRKEGPRAASLCFRGGHLIGEGTTVVASWKTPYSAAKRRPQLRLVGEFPTVNLLEDIRFELAVRFQVQGESWSRWDKDRFRLHAGAFGGFLEGDYTVISDDSVRVRFQWRIVVRIEAPATLDGHVDLAVR